MFRKEPGASRLRPSIVRTDGALPPPDTRRLTPFGSPMVSYVELPMCKLIDTIRRRRFSRVAVCFALVVGIGVGIAYATRTIRPTRERFEQVKVGMTNEQVNEIIGGPPGDYTGGEYSGSAEAWRASGWVSRECELIVHFNEVGVATNVRIGPVVVKYQPPLMERIRDAFGF